MSDVTGSVDPTRAQFDAGLRPAGAFLIGDAETVTEKILTMSADLGGLDRISFQMSIASLSHARMLHAIEILGTEVAPEVKKALRETNLKAS